MILVRKNLIGHLLFAVYRKIYVKVFWILPTLLPKIKVPYTIELELTNHCNMVCIHCHRKKMSRQLGFMDFSLFKKIIDEISDYPIGFIRIVGQGESSLHPDLKIMMEYMRSKRIKVEFTTNGSIFEKYSFDEILSWNIDILGISIDGVDEDSYNKIRINGNYYKLKQYLTDFYNYRNSLTIKYPVIKVRNVIFPHFHFHQIEDFKKEWLQISDYVNFNTFCPIDGSDNFTDQLRCKAIFFDAHVRWDGSVPLCDNLFLYSKDIWLGNLKQNSLRELWKHSLLSEAREFHLKRNLDTLHGCKFCFKAHKNKLIINNFKQLNASKNTVTNIINRFINIT